MQRVLALVALGGDRDTTVPKTITAAEIPVLQAIHGSDAVFDIEFLDEIQTDNRTELTRLREVYGQAKNEADQFVMPLVYPGAAARVFQTIDEIGLDDVLFKAGRPVRPAPAPAAKKGRKKAAEPVVEPAINEEADAEAEADEDEDDIADLANSVIG